VMATPPMRFWSSSKCGRRAAATSFRTETASLVTSGPMPSPAVTRIFSFIADFSSGAKARLFDKGVVIHVRLKVVLFG
jgi:hypothetical protein